jgi:hypothetical protein
MADIDIVRKERSNLWIWIVLAIVILLALYFIFGRGPNSVQNGLLFDLQPSPAAVACAPPAIA